MEPRQLSATILRDGTVRNVDFELFCRDDAAGLCNPELKRQILTAITSSNYEPGSVNGKAIEMRVRQNHYPACEYDSDALKRSR